MSEFKEIFEAYGADYETTMERFMGNEEMYRGFLDMMFKDESFHRLGDALDCGDLTAAFEAAHTFKGVAGNMGLTPLYDAVCVIVEPLRAGEQRGDYAALYEMIQSELKRVDELRQRLAGGAPV